MSKFPYLRTWVKAMRAQPEKQTYFTTATIRGGEVCFCAMGALINVHPEVEFDREAVCFQLYGTWIVAGNWYEVVPEAEHEAFESFEPVGTIQRYSRFAVEELNDTLNLTFPQIAALVEAHLDQLEDK